MKVISKDHNKLFKALQEKYLKNRTPENLSNLYLLLKDYYNNLFIEYTHRKGLYWNDDTIEEKSEDASTIIICRYLKDPEFKINRLTAYAHYPKLKVLYGDKDFEKNNISYELYSIGLDEENNINAVRFYDTEYEYKY